MGPLGIYSKGKLDDPGVDKEIPLLFNVQNEMQSVYFKVGTGRVQREACMCGWVRQPASSLPD